MMKNPRLYLHIIVLIICSLTFGFSFKSEASLYRTCVRLLSAVSSPAADTPAETVKTINNLESSVEITGFELGSHGGLLNRVEPKVDSWKSFVTRYYDNPQGDVRWPLQILGEKTANFFGFKWSSRWSGFFKRTLLLPEVDELNGALSRLLETNKHDLKFNPITLYEEYRFKTPDREYVTRFALNRAIPIAPEGSFYFHDLDYHFLGYLLAPTEYFELARLQAQILVDFDVFVRRKLGDAIPMYLSDRLNSAFEKKAKELDLGSAAITQAYTNLLGYSDEFDQYAKVAERAQNYFCRKGLSPKLWLEMLYAPGDQMWDQALTEFIEMRVRSVSAFEQGLRSPFDVASLVSPRAMMERLGHIDNAVFRASHENANIIANPL